ncbi:MAG: peptidyl-prolyl cis-trans isomerase [Gammaproteobacteria bacterium]|nr:peptidyl-prolyl cis-trans isomerase [Gammaproteobacteria bacterium]
MNLSKSFLSTVVFCLATMTLAQAEPNPQVKIQTTLGEIVVELYPAKAPKTVANFLQYVDEGFYNNTIFHRVIDNFMIQGGGFTPDYTQKQTRAPVLNEANNGLKNDRGTIAMARTADPQSATAQFYINVANNTPLNFTAETPRGWGYCVFGKVTKGMEVVDAIRKLPTAQGGPFMSDLPQTPVIITNVSRIATALPPTKKPGK